MADVWDTWPKTGALLLLGHLENTFALAMSYAGTLLCASHLRSKALWEANTHPDFKALLIEDTKSTSPVIKVDQLRDLIAWSTGRPQIAAQKVVVIYPAEAMNVQASNALLKTLEEPQEDTLIILVCEQAAFLAATLRSRCFKVRCTEEATRPSCSWPTGMIEEVQGIIEGKLDPSTLAERWIKQASAKEWVSGLWILCASKMRASAETGSFIRQKSWWILNQQLMDARKQLEEFPASNAQLLLENILFAHVGVDGIKN
jgi:hypothetical protein